MEITSLNKNNFFFKEIIDKHSSLKLWSIYLPTREKMTDLSKVSNYYVGGICGQINLISLKLWSIYLPTREKMTDLLEISNYYVGGYCSQMILDSLKLWYIDLSMRKKITNLLSYMYARTEGFLFCIS